MWYQSSPRFELGCHSLLTSRKAARLGIVLSSAILSAFVACSGDGDGVGKTAANDSDAQSASDSAPLVLDGSAVIPPDAMPEAGDTGPTRLASVLGLRTIVREGTRVYYSNGNSLGFVETAGGAPVTILAGLTKMTGALTVRDNFVYFSDSTQTDKYATERVAVAGTSRKLLADWFYSWEVGVLGANAYLWNPCFTTNTLCAGKSAGIVRIPADGTAGGTFLTSTASNVNHLVVTDEFVVWAEDDVIRSIPLAGGTAKTVASEMARSLAVSADGYAYWTRSTDDNKASISRAQAEGSSAVPQQLVAEDGYFDKVLVDGSDIYWLARPTLADLASIKHATIGSPTTDMFFQSPPGRSVMSIALDATTVYFATGDGIYTLPR